MSELLNCPFCGGEAEFERKGTGKVSCIVKCTDCGCTLESGETFSSGESWNTRTQSQWISEDALKIIEAVAYIGVDFGFGKYEIENAHIDSARRILESKED